MLLFKIWFLIDWQENITYQCHVMTTECIMLLEPRDRCLLNIMQFFILAVT